jgi:hypothetical protein
MSQQGASTHRAQARSLSTPCPAEVSPGSWRALGASLSRALREKTARGAAPARVLVFQIVLELRTAAVSWERIEAVMLQALSEHPELGQLDRFDVVSGKQTSDVLRSWMLGWVHRARQVDAPTAARGRPMGDRINVQKAETILERLPTVLERQLVLGRRADPTASPAALLDRALRHAVKELRFALTTQTYEYLRWRVERQSPDGLGRAIAAQ